VGLRISTNLLSLSTQRNLATTTRALQRSMQRLSSGSRINTGRDDPAGLAMASGLESQRRGLLQAVRNINDSRGFLETADGAMAEQTSMIQRMRELAVQASNGTLEDTTRRYLNNEFQSLLAEFNRLTTQTQFNGINLLDGSFGTKNIQVGSQKAQTIAVGLTSMMASQVFTTTSTTTGSSSTTPTGTFQAKLTLNTGSSPLGVVSGDINGDGKADLINGDTGDSLLNIFLGNGNGTFAARQTLYATYGAGTFSNLADTNGDGKLDLISTFFFDGIGVFLGNGNGTFQSGTIFGGSGHQFVPMADINGDGKIDIVTNNAPGNAINILLGNGNGTFQSPTTLAAGLLPEPVALADLNGDSKLDIIDADANGNTVSVFLGNGNGTFAARTTLAAGLYPQSIFVADLNGDGKTDLMTADSNGNTVSIFIGNGNGTFAARTTVATGGYPNTVWTADISGDGKLDLITADKNTNVVSIAIGNGNGTFQTRSTLGSGSAPLSAITADINGDGVQDIVATDSSSGTLSVFIQNSTTNSTQGGTITTPASIYLTTQSSAQDAIAVLDTALAYVNSARASIGALQSRLDFASSVNQNTIENISAARSEIMDVDLAAETAEFSRLQILQKAGVAVLGQANLSTQLSLKLLANL
jgi:flagellin-like hook-associated protein FlgL